MAIAFNHRNWRGYFTHADTKCGFHWRDNDTGQFPMLPHLILVGPDYLPEPQRLRFGRVLKTVAHVAIDEADDGSPVLERWPLGRNVAY
jgi:hypothetical protein